MLDTTPVKLAVQSLTNAQRKKIPKRPPKILPATNAERKYARDLAKLTRALEQIAERIVKKLPAIQASAEKLRPDERADAYPEEIEGVMNAARAEWNRIASPSRIAAMVKPFVEATNKQNKKATGGFFKKTLGIDVIGSEPWLKPELDAAIKANVNLIKTLGPETFNRIETAVFEGVRSGQLTKGIAEAIQKATGATKSRAQFIARDQAAKVSGNLSKLRQEQVGITEYIWSTSRDERVVGNPAGLYPTGSAGHMNHWAREGKTFKWAKPPADGHPGFAYGCRCVSVPKLPD